MIKLFLEVSGWFLWGYMLLMGGDIGEEDFVDKSEGVRNVLWEFIK
jgi:hypothetical protein